MITGFSPAVAEGISRENLTLEVTTRCGGACPHCFVRPGARQDLDMGLNDACSLVREGADLGYRNLHLTGGDPFLWAPCAELAREAAAAGYAHLFINTTGTHLSAVTLSRLAQCGIEVTLSISVEGPPERHDALRGPGSRDRALAGAALALEAGLAVSVFTAAGRGLVPFLAPFARDLFEALPALRDLTLIQIVRAGGAGDFFDAEMLSPGEFTVLARTAAMLNLLGKPVGVLDNPLAVAAARAGGLPWLPATGPLVRPGRLVVLVDGETALAHSLRTPLGFRGPGSLAGALASPAYGRAVAGDRTTCLSCRHRDLCAGAGMTGPSEPWRDPGGGTFCIKVMDCCVEGAR